MVTDKEVTSFINHALSCGLGMVFEEASKTWNLCSFTFSFLGSDTFSSYFTDETLFSQSPRYVLQIFKEELDKKHIKYPKTTDLFEEDVAHWIGFLLAQWYLEYSFNVLNLSEEQFDWLYFGYDTLHTQSIKYVYDLFKEVFQIQQ